MILAVHDDVVMHPDDGADDAKIRLEARGEGDGGVLVQEVRKLLLQLEMQLERSVEEAGAGAAGAKLLIGPDTRLDDLRAGREAQIVVGAEHDAALALHHDLDILPGFERMEIRVKPALADVVRQHSFFTFFK